MSDTLETDKAAYSTTYNNGTWSGGKRQVVDSDFARRLERERNAARAEVERLRKAADLSLAAMQDVLEAAYHRCYQSCCGRPGMECCGNPVQTWTEDDEHIMKTLGSVEKSLRATLATKEQAKP